MTGPTVLDHALVMLITVGLPLHVLLFWFPRVKRAVRVHPRWARHRAYLEGNAVLWGLSGLTLLVWTREKRPPEALGFGAPSGWGFWVALALTAGAIAFLIVQRLRLTRQIMGGPVGQVSGQGSEQVSGQLTEPAEPEDVRAMVERHLEPLRAILPQSRGELWHFGVVSLTAGVCEETLFRGFVLWYLAQLIPFVLAIVVSALLFGMAHAYQGNRGVLQTALVGLGLGVVYALAGSLWVPMLLHAAVDMNSGLTAYAVLTGGAPNGARRA